MSEYFSVILTGEIIPDHKVTDVVTGLAKFLGIPELEAEFLLAGQESVVNPQIHQSDVQRYIDGLHHIGAGLRVEASQLSVLSTTTEDSAGAARPAIMAHPLELVPDTVAYDTDKVNCPFCGVPQFQNALVCVDCGHRISVNKPQIDEKLLADAPSVSDSGNVNEIDSYTPPAIAFSLKGRIGRLRLLAFQGMALLLPLIPGIVLINFYKPDEQPYLYILLTLCVLYRPWVLRLHDLNISGLWLLLTSIILLVISQIFMVSVLITLVMMSAALLLWPGQHKINDFGPPPAENPPWIKIVAFLSVIVIAVVVTKQVNTGMLQLAQLTSAFQLKSSGRLNDSRTFSPPNGRFHINMPGVPVEKWLGSQVYSYTLIHEGWGYVVTCYDQVKIPPNLSASFDLLEKKSEQTNGSSIVWKKTVSRGAGEGREIRFVRQDGSIYETLYLYDHTTLYEVIIAPPKEAVDTKIITAFLNSFEPGIP
jgi:uncharacterized membrane protein YhaH (DUF805 family)